MLYYFKKGKNAPETPTHKRFVQCGQTAVTDQMCQKWFVKLPTGGSSLDQAPGFGRPAEVESDQIETITENNQHYTMWETADILKTYK